MIEGNHIYNTDIGGPSQDGKRSARDIIVRNNYYKNVGRGPFWNLGTLGAETGSGALSRPDQSAVGTVSGLSNFAGYEAGVRVKVVTTPGTFTGLHLIQSKTATILTITVPKGDASLVEATSVRKVYA